MNNAVLAILVAAVLLFAFLWWRALWSTSRNNRRRFAIAQAAETEAEALLQAEGFRILDRQVTTTWLLQVDGEHLEVSCRADLLVEARRRSRFPRGTRYIAEVKSGALAPNPTRPATRRQLMEYQMAFDVDGVLLIDMEKRNIHHVVFTPQRRPG